MPAAVDIANNDDAVSLVPDLFFSTFHIGRCGNAMGSLFYGRVDNLCNVRPEVKNLNYWLRS